MEMELINQYRVRILKIYLWNVISNNLFRVSNIFEINLLTRFHLGLSHFIILENMKSNAIFKILFFTCAHILER